VAVVTVPDITGLLASAAIRRLVALGLTYRVTDRINPTVRPGAVISTDPAAGSLVAAGTEVVVTVARPT
jgi:serine/threonine-protein kinase